MNDENKEAMVDQQKGAEERTQLSEEALSNVSGGYIKITFTNVFVSNIQWSGGGDVTAETTTK
jgi:hypothetical protein